MCNCVCVCVCVCMCVFCWIDCLVTQMLLSFPISFEDRHQNAPLTRMLLSLWLDYLSITAQLQHPCFLSSKKVKKTILAANTSRTSPFQTLHLRKWWSLRWSGQKILSAFFLASVPGAILSETFFIFFPTSEKEQRVSAPKRMQCFLSAMFVERKFASFQNQTGRVRKIKVCSLALLGGAASVCVCSQN